MPRSKPADASTTNQDPSTLMRQTRARASLPGAAPLMRGLDGRGRPLGSLPPDTGICPQVRPATGGQPRTRIILHTSVSRNTSGTERNPAVRRRIRIILHTDGSRQGRQGIERLANGVVGADREAVSRSPSRLGSRQSSPRHLSDSGSSADVVNELAVESGLSEISVSMTGHQRSIGIPNWIQQLPQHNHAAGDGTTGHQNHAFTSWIGQVHGHSPNPDNMIEQSRASTGPNVNGSNSLAGPGPEVCYTSPFGDDSLSYASMVTAAGSVRNPSDPWQEAVIVSNPWNRGSQCPHCGRA